ncbi:MAG TPA: efflux RND transporter periplasmic adaptor subunit, partial [Polyangiaceae bacterium]|nr:efflux RND transporter periplasmic adaptor subunit [Polyangiaceae bacterium]
MNRSTPSRRKRLWLIAALCLSGAGAAAWGFGRGHDANGAVPHKADGRGAEPAPVTVAPVRSEDVPIEIHAFGSVEASSTVDVVPQVTGLITQVHFTEGSFVQKGELLFSVDTRPYRASLAAAQAELSKNAALAAQAQSEAQRYAELVHQGVATDQQLTQARAEAATARAQVEEGQAQIQSASLNVKFTRITAPISGKTGSLLVHAGNVIQANAPQPLVVIRSLSPVQVRFAVPQTYLTEIRQSFGRNPLGVKATPRGEGAETAEGQLTFLENTVDPSTGTLGLKATFANTGLELWPGAAVEVRLELGVDRQALVVPAEAVRDSQQGSYVFVIRDDQTATQRPVEVARSTPTLALIREGLRAGERIATDGYLRLREGT